MSKILSLAFALCMGGQAFASWDFREPIFKANMGKLRSGTNTTDQGPCSLVLFEDTLYYDFFHDHPNVKNADEAINAYMSTERLVSFRLTWKKGVMVSNSFNIISHILDGGSGYPVYKLFYDSKKKITALEYSYSIYRDSPPEAVQKCVLN